MARWSRLERDADGSPNKEACSNHGSSRSTRRTRTELASSPTARPRLEPEHSEEREAERFQHLHCAGFQLLLGPDTSGADVTCLFSVIDAGKSRPIEIDGAACL